MQSYDQSADALTVQPLAYSCRSFLTQSSSGFVSKTVSSPVTCLCNSRTGKRSTRM